MTRAPRRRSLSWGDPIWRMPEDHPQRLLAQPLWRQRQWMRRKTERENELADMLENAPALMVRYYLGGLMRSQRTL